MSLPKGIRGRSLGCHFSGNIVLDLSLHQPEPQESVRDSFSPQNLGLV